MASSRVGLSTMPKSPKLERQLSDCFELLDQESSALASEDLERISEVLKIKESSFASLNSLLEDEPVEEYEEQVRLLYDRTNENAEKLDELMEKTDRELALISRGRNRLRGLRNSYVKVPREGYLDRSQRFEA